MLWRNTSNIVKILSPNFSWIAIISRIIMEKFLHAY